MITAMHFARRSFGGGAATLIALGLLAGCQTTAPNYDAQLVPREGSAELVAYLADQPYLTAEPAYRATYALATGSSFGGDFAALKEEMRERELISPLWQHEPNHLLTRGDVGYLVCRACDIRTGLNWNLTKLGRYAWRELIYHDVAERGSAHSLISGGEFVGVLSRAEDYMARTGKRESGVELGEPEGLEESGD